MVLIITALRRIGRGTFSKLFDGMFFLGLMGWDFSLIIVNLITFKRRVGRVTPKGQPGEGGIWPEYIPPRQGDSRCSCPALNAMANHGSLFFHFVIPSSGPPSPRPEMDDRCHTPYHTTLHFLFLNRLVVPLRYPPPRRTQHFFPRAIGTGPSNLQLFSFIQPLRTTLHRQNSQPFIQHRALRPVGH